MMKSLHGSLLSRSKLARVTPLSAMSTEYMNLLIVLTTKPPASLISTSFHFSLPANTFHQPPRILT